jgi:hypothetical protein
MTNNEAWQCLTANCPSPQPFIDFGWLWLNASALERRVWFGNFDSMLGCNMYVVLVGRAGVGKGLLLSPIKHLLKYNRDLKALPYVVAGGGLEHPPILRLGSDSTTYEGMLHDLAKSTKSIKRPDTGKIYAHASMAVALEEMSSLFRKHQSDIGKLMLNAYDCGSYDYKPKNKELQDIIRNMCLNFIAGTTPDFLQEASNLRMFDDGLVGRLIFVFDYKSRFYSFEKAPVLSPEQEKAQKQLERHILGLTKIFGQVTYNAETAAWLQDWGLNTHLPKLEAAHPRMAGYYARKEASLKKVACAMHFSEYGLLHTSMEIPLATFQAAIALLDSIEGKMLQGFLSLGKNKYMKAAEMVRNLLKCGPKTLNEISVHILSEIESPEEIKLVMDLVDLQYGLVIKATSYSIREGKL